MVGRHHGVISGDQLARFGFNHRAIQGLCASGTLRRVRRDVFVVGAVPATELQRAALASVATGGVASHGTAGRLWGLRQLPPDRATHVTVAYGLAARPGGLVDVVIHRTRSLPPGDIVGRADGIPLTSPPRTLFDLAGCVSFDALESMVEQAIDRSLCSVPTLWAVAQRLGRRGRAGSTAFADLLGSRPTGREPVGSHDELRLERALVDAGLPRPERQWPVRLAGGQVVHPDLAWPDIRLAVEVDHSTWHDGRDASTYDTWRDRQLRLVDWEVDRVTDTAVREQLAATVKDLVALYRRRAAAHPCAGIAPTRR